MCVRYVRRRVRRYGKWEVAKTYVRGPFIAVRSMPPQQLCARPEPLTRWDAAPC